MPRLYEPLPASIDFDGRTYRLDLAFDNVLACMDILGDARVPEQERPLWVLLKLVPDRKVRRLSSQARGDLLEAVFRDMIRPRRRGGGETKNTKDFDFSLDADLIYASFWQAYQIDLYKMQGKLHWWQFYALFQGLPAGTKMAEVIDIRKRPLPTPNAHNQETVQALMRLKQYYALPGVDAGEGLQEGGEKLWAALESKAVRKHD